MTNPHHIFVDTRLHSHPYRKNFRAGQGWGKSKATQGRDRAWIPARGLVLPCRVVKFTMRDNCQFMSESAAVACTTWAITGRAWAGSSELGSSFRAAAAPIRREAARAGPALPCRGARPGSRSGRAARPGHGYFVLRLGAEPPTARRGARPIGAADSEAAEERSEGGRGQSGQ